MSTKLSKTRRGEVGEIVNKWTDKQRDSVLDLVQVVMSAHEETIASYRAIGRGMAADGELGDVKSGIAFVDGQVEHCRAAVKALRHFYSLIESCCVSGE